MVQFRAFSGYTFQPELYAKLLGKDLQHFQETQMHKIISDFNLEELVEDGSLQESARKCMYLYQQQYQCHTSLGIVGELNLRDYEHDHIKKHEQTLTPQNKNHDHHLIAETHIAPVVVGHRHFPEIDGIIRKVRETKKCFASWNTADGRRHTLWKIPDHSKITALYEQLVDCLCILDGHHRFKAAFQHLEKEGKNAQDKDYWILAIVYSSHQVKVFPQYRCLVDPRSFSIIQNIMKDPRISLQQLKTRPQKLALSSVLMIYEQKYYQISEIGSAHERKHSQKLGIELLSEILQRSAKGVEKLNGDTVQIVYKPSFQVEKSWEQMFKKGNPLFIVEGLTIEQIFNRAGSHQMLPPKSTWLEPKPCLHMIIRLPY